MDEQEILNAAAQAADVEAPKAPEFTAPQQPQYQPPQYQPQPQYQAPQYQPQPQYQAPQQPQYPQYQQPQYQQPQYRAPQYQPAPAAAPAKGSKVGNIMGIIGFACSMLALLLGFIGLVEILDGSFYQLESALSLWVWSLVFCIPGLVCGIIGLAKKGKKGFALTAVIVSAILLLLAIIFIAVIAEEVSSYRYYW